MNGTSPGALPLPVVPGLTDLSVFARGGYATVYRATQASVGREVAVKVENRTLDTERDQRRFLREARAAGRMSSHPHVVDLFDAGVTEDRHPYLIMELCDGSYARTDEELAALGRRVPRRRRQDRRRAGRRAPTRRAAPRRQAGQHPLLAVQRAGPGRLRAGRAGRGPRLVGDAGGADPGVRRARDVPAQRAVTGGRRLRPLRDALRDHARQAAALARRPGPEPGHPDGDVHRADPRPARRATGLSRPVAPRDGQRPGRPALGRGTA